LDQECGTWPGEGGGGEEQAKKVFFEVKSFQTKKVKYFKLKSGKLNLKIRNIIKLKENSFLTK
jgi:hypothetical protein